MIDPSAPSAPAVRSWSLALMCVCLVTGCQSMCSQWAWCPLCPPPCRLSSDTSQAELVEYLNRNIQQLVSWRSTDVKITVSDAGVPIKFPSVVAVESPRNFRLMVNSLAGSEADLGSNYHQFWFWSNRSKPKYILTATHDDVGRAQQRLQIPFEPEWLMEAMGVIPIDDRDMTMVKPRPNAQRAHLITDLVTPQQQRVRKVMVVDTCQGVVLEQILYDANGQLIAKATFADHQSHSAGPGPAETVTMPHRIGLSWPMAGVTLSMVIGQFEINPPKMPDQTWQLPHYPDSPVYDLGQ